MPSDLPGTALMKHAAAARGYPSDGAAVAG
jgi:hypothetical protein